ncbi:MAG TPA: exodeoxyribonuclease III [Sedimenticola sp.]|nr:exodeoxyribonuclease III [Sedimenticola sp.]
MKIVSFNTNGIRARPHQLQALRDRYRPDVIGIQETKVQDAEFPLAMVGELGYQAACFGQKGHYGVALLSRDAPLAVEKGLPGDGEEAQRRLITGWFETTSGTPVTVINGYFPQGENREHPVKFPAKQRFYRDLLAWLEQRFTPEDLLVVMGDMNVAPLDLDVGIGPDNARRWLRNGKCSFLPEEREWLERLQAWGLEDSYQVLHPEEAERYSWFDYRSRGFDRAPRRGLRIDLILATRPLIERLRGAGIAHDIRAMERPSDHCPVWAAFDI